MEREYIKIYIPEKFINKPSSYPDENLPYEEIKRRFIKIVGKFDYFPSPLKIKVTDEAVLPGDVIKQRIVYYVDGEWIPAFHLFLSGIPKDAPGILSIHAHGSGNDFYLGKEMHCKPDMKDPYQYSYHLALKGFRVLAPDAFCFGERITPWGYSREFFDEINAGMELIGRGKSFCWKSLRDNSAAIRVLKSLGAKKIGSIGFSGGSTQNYILAAVNPKVEAAVCIASFMTLRHQFYKYRLAHCLYHFIPNMVKENIDWDQVVSLIPPRKLLLCAGDKDEGTPLPVLKTFVKAIKKRCKKEGLPPSVWVYIEPGVGHKITKNILDKSIEFLFKHLS